MRGRTLLLMSMSFALAAPGAAQAAKPKTAKKSGGTTTASSASASGGSVYGIDPTAPPRKYVAGSVAKRLKSGLAAAPTDAPKAVQEAIFAANEIVGKPYVYGGGHNRTFSGTGYDCSGTVSYALNGAGLLDAPLASGPFMTWGKKGSGDWITVYAHGGHAWVKIAGLRLDTSAAGERSSSGKGPRWRKNLRGGRGFVRRHPAGL